MGTSVNNEKINIRYSAIIYFQDCREKKKWMIHKLPPLQTILLYNPKSINYIHNNDNIIYIYSTRQVSEFGRYCFKNDLG